MGKFVDRLKHGWNAFVDNKEDEHTVAANSNFGVAYGTRPDRTKVTFSNEKSMVNAIYTRIGIDVSAIDLRHVRMDENGRYLEDMKSRLNECLTISANLDQAARMFRQDMVHTLLDKGVIAIVPVDVTSSPVDSNAYDILSLRVGEVVGWYPEHVRVSLYNQKSGAREEIVVGKDYAAIVENPFFAIMNMPNSTLQRLIWKLNILDAVDKQSGSGKLDIIIQLPYTIKSESKRAQADNRLRDIELQLKNSQYGIAYADATERITQLNRPSENNLLKQVEYLTELAYSQLGVTEEIMNGTADEQVMLNYINRTVEPIIDAIAEAMHRTFLTRAARTQRQAVYYSRDPFKLVPINNIAEIADKFTRNEILSANEIRSIVGVKPSKDPKADELRNSNMPAPEDKSDAIPKAKEEEGDSQNGT